ncbi:MAG: excinuclease ABC subunit UvrC [Firmicutes bacterium]|nr:excinuclease ABC subunit UvrC [Bacillota bacterium]
MPSPKVKEKLSGLPRLPGVYLFKDKQEQVIYVGKAVNLRSRVRSYFTTTHHNARLRALVERIEDLDFMVTDSELEAFILEANLIKEYRPRFNVSFKDDKQYPYLRLTLEEAFPRLVVARKPDCKGSRYFGPYSSAGAMRETLRLLKKLFPLRHCRQPLKEGQPKGRPCLNYQIKRCLGPCRGDVSREEYMKMVKDLILFLEGKGEKLLKELEKEMKEAASRLDYERAARLRDRYRSVALVLERQKVVSVDGGDRDIIALTEVQGEPRTALFRVRAGKLTEQDYFTLTNTEGLSEEEMMAAFLRHYYSHQPFIPSEILLSHRVAEEELVAAWLKKMKGKKVKIHVPRRGEKKELVRLAAQNAQLRWKKDEESADVKALNYLTRLFNADKPITDIEGYDISHLGGEEGVGVAVLFRNGQPCKEGYRRYSLRDTPPADDYLALQEVMRRRLDGHDPLPHLFLIDGGRGQLNAVAKILQEKGLQHFPLMALAKEEEHLFLLHRHAPLVLPSNHPALKLLQRIRDEAHRFAISYSRLKFAKKSLGSILEEVPGIGPSRRKALLSHFKGISEIKEAAPEKLAAVPGMNSSVAQALYEYLRSFPD